VIDRVESFRCVQKEAQPLDITLDTLKEKLVDLEGVVHAVLSSQEALLGGLDEVRNRWHNEVSHRRGQKAIVSIGNADRAGVRNQTCVLLRN